MFSSNIFKSTQNTKAISSTEQTDEWLTMLTEATIQFEDDAFQGAYEFSQASVLSYMDKNPTIVEEGMIDFARTITSLVKTFIQKIRDFFKKYKLYVLSYTESFDKFLRRHVDELRDMTINEFTVMGFDFGRPLHKPDLSTLYSIVADYNTELKELNEIDIAELRKRKEEYTMEQNGSWLRDKVMQMSSHITAEEYPTEIFKFYREGATEPIELKIGQKEFQDARVGYGLVKKWLKNVDDLEKDTLKLFNTLEKFFASMPNTRINTDTKHISTKSMSRDEGTINFSDGPSLEYNDSNLSKTTLFYQYKWEQVRMLNPIITQALSGRITAYKDEMTQNADIVRKGILKAKLAPKKDSEEGDE